MTTDDHWVSPINNYSSHDSLSQNFNQKGRKSKKDIVDGIAALPYKIYVKSKKQKILNYLNDNRVSPEEIFDWLSNNQSKANSLLVLGDFYYLGIATEVDKQKAYNFYLRAGDRSDGLSIAQYNLGFMCENDIVVSGDTFEAMHWYGKSAEQGIYEAHESLNRLRGSISKTFGPGNKYSMEALGKYGM
jgi:TPR repeat protein